MLEDSNISKIVLPEQRIVFFSSVNFRQYPFPSIARDLLYVESCRLSKRLTTEREVFVLPPNQGLATEDITLTVSQRNRLGALTCRRLTPVESWCICRAPSVHCVLWFV